MEKEVKLNGEKIKEAYEKAKDIDIVSLLKTFIQLLKVYGYFGKKIGILQTENKDAFEAITYLGSIAPDFMDSVAKKSPPEEFGVFAKAFLELMEVAPKMDMIMELSGEEKIATGDQILEITRTFEEMLNAIEAKKKQETQ